MRRPYLKVGNKSTKNNKWETLHIGFLYSSNQLVAVQVCFRYNKTLPSKLKNACFQDSVSVNIHPDLPCQYQITGRKFQRQNDENYSSVKFSRVWLFEIPWTIAHQASLFITNSRSLPKIMSIESVMPFNYLILCHPLLLLPSSIFPNIRVFSSEWALPIRWPK